MRYTVFIILLVAQAGAFNNQAMAQRTAAYRDIEFTYRTAIDLFNKKQYSAAAKHFEEVVNNQKNTGSEMVINSTYHIALAHLYLFRKDAEHLLITFLREHPHASQCKTIYFLLGKHYYQQKRYQKAVDYFQKVDKFDLNETQLAEYYFKWGHSNFQLGKREPAIIAFNEIRNTENAYQKPAIYYYAHLSYEDKKYAAALENFLKIEKEPGYKTIVPYYITQIYYFQGDYNKAIEYGLPLLDSVVPKREAELNLVIGSSYYNLKKYDQAYPYLEKYANTGAPGRDESYRIGFCALETKQYQKAVTWFNKCVNTNDELAQTAWYHMAMAYLKGGKKEEARQTFSRCMKLEFNPAVQEDAHYNYVKLNYELSFNPYHDAIASVKTYFEKYPESTKTEELKTYLVSMFLAGKNYESAYHTLNELKNKDLSLQRSFQLVVYNLGTDLFNKSEYEKSRKYFSEVKRYPIDKNLNAEGYFWIGESNYLEEKWDDAIQGYTRFLEEPGAVSNQYYNRAQYNLGYCWMQKGYLAGDNVQRSNATQTSSEMYAQSLVHFRTFTTYKNESDNLRLNDAYLRMGDIYYIRADNATALTYYDKAYTSGMSASKDYALFQKAMCAGYTGKRDDKIAMLKNMLASYKQSRYIGDAKFEIAETYRVLENKNAALEWYTKVVKEHPDKFLKVKHSRFEIALILYRNKEYDASIKAYKEILKEYTDPQDVEDALEAMKPVYSDAGKVDEWVALMKQYNKFDKNKFSADTTYFNSADRYREEKNYAKAVDMYNNYLVQFNPAIFELNATFYLGECLELLDKKDEAIPYYEKVAGMPNSKFTNHTLRKLVHYYVEKKDWAKAVEYEHRIETSITDPTDLLYAYQVQMRGHYNLKNNSDLFNYAKKVIDSPKAGNDDRAEAYYYRAKMAFEQNNMVDAENDFKEVEKLTNKEWKAEAAFTRCLIKYNKGEHVYAEKDLYAFFKQKPSYNYWTAKGYILLAKNYCQLDDTAQAKATLKSVIDGYTIKTDGIAAEATEELNKITEAENRMQQKKAEIIKGNEENGEKHENE
ncbi:MAG TPA: tetratricopeptide repeat protein [Flavobacteriales bacterium]|nr:tetratricopeptide repeat protein [Flavobacteriales bacterium]